MLAVSTVSAGNAGDTIARIVLDQVSKQIGQSCRGIRSLASPSAAHAPRAAKRLPRRRCAQ
jgi:hypothetical protein